MSSAVVLTFIATVLVVVMILLTRRVHGRFSEDSSSGPQKFHARPTPRVAGIAILAGLVIGLTSARELGDDFELFALLLLLAAIPAIAGGLLEDLLKRVSVAWRLGLTFA